MKPYPLIVCITLLLSGAGSHAQELVHKQITRPDIMRASFLGFEEVLNPKTGSKEFVFNFAFLDVPPRGELKALRRGDQFAGYTVGEFINRKPVWRSNDGYVEGTLPTLEFIHTKSGKKYFLELDEHGRVYALPRGR